MYNDEIIGGIVFLVLLATVVIMMPYYWCVIIQKTDFKFVCFLPFVLF